jgi:hypothetical protein
MIDCPGMDEQMFDSVFFSNELNKLHWYSIPLIVYSLTSGIPDLVSYNEVLKPYKNTEVPVYFIVTHIKDMINNIQNDAND